MENYEILGMVGEGSFGRVYKAKRKENNETVALKVIRKRGRSTSELISFQRECEIQRHLCHPNIIRMLDSFNTATEMVVVTEFAHRELHSILAKEGSLGETRAQELSWDLVSALYYLHSHRVLHRDLKPQNILLDLFGKAKLCDFGLARNMTTGTHVLTSIKGTPLYMAPELMAEQPYDHQADLWSLGCIIYETLVGEPPFCTTSILHLVRLIKHEKVRWPSFISENCILFLQGLLQKNPFERMPWAAILEHPFVAGHILILDEKIPESPFTHPLSASQSKAKERQHSLAIENKPSLQDFINKPEITNLSLPDVEVHTTENTRMGSTDSTKAVFTGSPKDSLKTDIEATQSESEVDMPKKVDKILNEIEPKHKSKNINKFAVLNANNLVVTNMNSNIKELSEPPNSHSQARCNQIGNPSPCKQSTDRKFKKSFLEKRKLSQNLDNFSLKLNQGDATKSNVVEKVVKNVIRSKSDLVKSKNIKESTQSNYKGAHCVRSLTERVNDLNLGVDPTVVATPGVVPEQPTNTNSSINVTSELVDIKEKETNEENDTANGNKSENEFSLGTAWGCTEGPIENDEWLAFLHKTMAEVVDGEIDSLKEKNIVSIIVSPLRHQGVSCAVAKSVADILALPLVLGNNPDDIDIIKNVYLEVKTVPNLIYASTLLYKKKQQNNSKGLTTSCTKETQTKGLLELSIAELQALESMYLLVCHLVHCGEEFVSQFCDAVVILSAKNLIQSFLSLVDRKTKLVGDVIAILSHTLCCLPENAELVEEIVLEDGAIHLVSFLKHSNEILRTRTCILLRLLGRFSCRALQANWTMELKNALEAVSQDTGSTSAEMAEETIAELKTLPFYSP